jgi:hypothetical protein
MGKHLCKLWKELFNMETVPAQNDIGYRLQYEYYKYVQSEERFSVFLVMKLNVVS